jgi:hypothetical protein
LREGARLPAREADVESENLTADNPSIEADSAIGTTLSQAAPPVDSTAPAATPAAPTGATGADATPGTSATSGADATSAADVTMAGQEALANLRDFVAKGGLEAANAMGTLVDIQIWVALIGLLGVGVGAYVTWMAQLSASKWHLIVDLHKEFNSETMTKSRNEAWDIVCDNWAKSFNEIADNNDLDNKALPLWNVMRFYHRLAVATRHNQVVRKHVCGLFGQVFVWWYVVSFDKMLRPSRPPSQSQGVWESWLDIDWLYEWMKKRTPSEKWNAWQKTAQDDIAKKGLYEPPPQAQRALPAAVAAAASSIG